LTLLEGERAHVRGIYFGLPLAPLLIKQQLSIFVGVMARSYGFITDAGLADIWVMDPKVQFIDDIKPLQETQLLRVRGVDGVQWAVPLYKGLLKARLANGMFQTVIVIGLDDATFIGGPATMVAGQLADLRRSDGIIVDTIAAGGKLARHMPDGTRVPLQIGDMV